MKHSNELNKDENLFKLPKESEIDNKNLIESIYQDPGSWRVSAGGMYFIHKHGARIFVAGNFITCKLNDTAGLSLLARWKVFKAFKWWCNHADVRYLGK